MNNNVHQLSLIDIYRISNPKYQDQVEISYKEILYLVTLQINLKVYITETQQNIIFVCNKTKAMITG